MTETYETTGPRCPYCKHLHRPDEPFYFDERNTEMECEHCGKSFRMMLYVSHSWTCEEA